VRHRRPRAGKPDYTFSVQRRGMTGQGPRSGSTSRSRPGRKWGKPMRALPAIHDEWDALAKRQEGGPGGRWPCSRPPRARGWRRRSRSGTASSTRRDGRATSRPSPLARTVRPLAGNRRARPPLRGARAHGAGRDREALTAPSRSGLQPAGAQRHLVVLDGMVIAPSLRGLGLAGPLVEDLRRHPETARPGDPCDRARE
jgi:hypothetical protein